MNRSSMLRRHALPALSIFVLLLLVASAFAQSRPQRPTTTNEKKNQRPVGLTEEQIREQAEKRRLEQEALNAPLDDDVLEIKVDLVNVNAVVYNKKSGQVITGLKKENFAVFEDGKRMEITNFAEPDAPITVSLVMEYSKWSEVFGFYGSSGQEWGHHEVIRPVAYFVSRFIKPPNDYASVIAFDMRPTPITDFTNDPNRLQQVVTLLLRNRPAFRENNLFDAVKFALVGGKADAVVLENSEERKIEYGGMVDVKAPRRAIILVASGIDTFSRINYDEARDVIRQTGIPIYIISTGNLFYKMYEHRLPATDSITGMPGRLTFLQARNAMNTFAKESGGRHYEMTFPGELPTILNDINTLMRHQYSIAYDLGDKRPPGKKYKLEVKVDVNGDGKFDEKGFEIQHRPYFVTEEEDKDDN